MLKKLTINNIALISELELDFCANLNILSGETGAGKSIIVDGIMLLLGERYDKTLLRFGQKSGYVEGVFDVNDSSREIMAELGFEDDDIIIINRRFNDDGRNEIRINGKMAAISTLRRLTAQLVDIYGQNEHQSLTKTGEHLRLLDYYVRHSTAKIKENLATTFRKYRETTKAMDELGDLEQRERTMDLLSYQIDEIEKAKVRKDEEEQLVDERKLILSAERVHDALSDAVGEISEQDASSIELLQSAMRSMSPLTELSETFAELYERLNSVVIELDDISDTMMTELDNAQFNEADLNKIEARLNIIRALKRKYGDYDKMNAFLEYSKQDLERLRNGADDYDFLCKEKSRLIADLYSMAVELSSIRRRGALELEKNIVAELQELGMNDSKFEIRFEDLPTLQNCEQALNGNGLDSVEFYLSPNKGQPLKPLIKIISGGEMSRFMLAMKVIFGGSDSIPTLIFDEVDTGISGSVGQAVAKKMARLSRKHQVLCVTHLAQIAAMADNHYFIDKDVENDKTITRIRLLSESGMIGEVSRLSGAQDISAQSELNAKEMKKWSEEYKNSIS